MKRWNMAQHGDRTCTLADHDHTYDLALPNDVTRANKAWYWRIDLTDGPDPIDPCYECLNWHAELLRAAGGGVLVREWHSVWCPGYFDCTDGQPPAMAANAGG